MLKKRKPHTGYYILDFLYKDLRECHSKQCFYHFSTGKPLYHQEALHVQEDCGHLLASRGSCPKVLEPRTSVMLTLHGNETITHLLLPVWQINSSVCKLACTIPKNCLQHPPGSYQKNDNGEFASVGSMWSVIMQLSSHSLYSRQIPNIYE